MNIDNYPILKDSDLDKFVEANYNLMIIGSHGTGKTERVLNCLKKHNLNYVYFSGSTLDPWIDFIGIPTKGNSGDMEFIRPTQINSDLEAIFIDEYNRSPKEVRNAIMELVQFKTMNGMKFPNLKFVWAAINPPSSDDNENDIDYDVEEIDAAQLDRFQAIVKVPTKPCLKWFKKKYGESGTTAVNWWSKQANGAKKEISPRRLDYALDAFKKQLPISNILPKCSNIKQLTLDLNTDPAEKSWIAFVNDPNPQTAQDFFSYKDLDKMKKIFQIPELTQYTVDCPEDLVISEYFKNKNYQKSFNVMVLCKSSKFNNIYESIKKTNPKAKEVKLFEKVRAVASVVSDVWKVEGGESKFVNADISGLTKTLRKRYFNTYDRNKIMDIFRTNKTKSVIPYDQKLELLLKSFKGMQTSTARSNQARIEKLFSQLDPRYYQKKPIRETLKHFETLGFNIKIPQSKGGVSLLLEKYNNIEQKIKESENV